MDSYPVVLENDDGIRPAGPLGKCFYCRQPVGKPHRRDCPIIRKKIRVQYIFTLDIDVPAHWDQHLIESHRNNGSWCADNAIDELQELSEKIGCLCPVFKVEVIGDVNQPVYRMNKNGEVVP